MLIPVLLFCALGAVRAAQRICSKKTSSLVEPGVKFFQYGAYYQALAAVVSIITLCIVGFHGFNLPTALCSLACACLLSITIFTSLEAVKGCTLILLNMVAVGSLVVPCIVGILLFDEPMGTWQWIGLAVFIASSYFLASDSGKTGKRLSFKTILLLIANFLSEGFLVVVQKYFAKRVPNGNTAVFSFLIFALNAIILFFCMLAVQAAASKKECGRVVLKLRPMEKHLYAYGAILALAVFAINMIVTTLAKTVDSVVLFSAESIISIIVTTAVGALLFKERITFNKIVGIAVGLIGIFLINS